jgi:MFS family permease
VIECLNERSPTLKSFKTFTSVRPTLFNLALACSPEINKRSLGRPLNPHSNKLKIYLSTDQDTIHRIPLTMVGGRPLLSSPRVSEDAGFIFDDHSYFAPWFTAGFNRRACFPIAAIMTLVSIIAICVALAKPHFYDQTLSTPFGDANIGVGLFKFVYDYAGKSHTRSIDNDCAIDLAAGLNLRGQIINQCLTFNVSRWFLVSGVIMLGISMFCQCVAAANRSIYLNAIIATVIGVFGSILCLIAMALLIDIKQSEHSPLFSNIDYGVSFVLLCVGWPLALVSALTFIPWGKPNEIIEL